MSDDDRRGETLEALFHAALERPPTEREAFLRESCGEDEALLERLRALLAQDEDGTSTLLRGKAVGGETKETLGRVGRYQLIEVLGEGGMGTVYLAEQQEPVRRKVALKRVRVGAGSDEVLARFETERQALALMDHPGIATIYDGGVADSGLPYFVMEYVRGLPLLEYANRYRLTIEERLELFDSICDAVQHAHQKGIVHRDLKPGNLLIAERDGRPQPKVIDFGIARAVSGPLNRERRTVTAGQTIGTYAYMSPEQADPRGQDIDTRTDIYSLGVVLYELLSGRRPFEVEDTEGDGWLQILRQLFERDAPLPSARTAEVSARAEEAAHERGLSPAGLTRALSGDLDWIVMRAIEKDRTRRYPTVSELKRDLERARAHEPVWAGPPTTRYRAAKFLRRHRLGVAMGALLIGLLVASVVTVSLALQRAVDAERATREQLAETRYQADKAEAFLEFLDYALSEGMAASSGQELTLLDLFEPTTAAIPELFANRPSSEAAARYVLGRAYLLMGNDRRALEQLATAYSIQKAARPDDHADLFATLQLLVHATRRAEGLEAAEPYVQPMLEHLREIVDANHPELTEDIDRLVELHEKKAAPDEQLRRLKALVAKLPVALDRGDQSVALGRLAMEVALQLPESDEVLAEFAEKARRIGGIRYLSYLWIAANIELLPDRRSYEAARRYSDELATECERSLAPEHWLSMDARRLKALVLAGLDPERFADAEAQLLALFDEVERMPGPRSTRQRGTQRGLYQLSAQHPDPFLIGDSWGRWSRADREAQDGRHWWFAIHEEVDPAARELVLETLDASPRDVVTDLHRAFALTRLGRCEEALEVLDRRGTRADDPAIEVAARALAEHGTGHRQQARQSWLRLQEVVGDREPTLELTRLMREIGTALDD